MYLSHTFPVIESNTHDKKLKASLQMGNSVGVQHVYIKKQNH
jgi:hypothetical protein